MEAADNLFLSDYESMYQNNKEDHISETIPDIISEPTPINDDEYQSENDVVSVIRVDENRNDNDENRNDNDDNNSLTVENEVENPEEKVIPIEIVIPPVDSIVDTHPSEEVKEQSVSVSNAQMEQELFKKILTGMTKTLANYYKFLHPCISLSGAFEIWLHHMSKKKSADLSLALEDANKVNSGLEQRVAKLKGLLARTYQSNQRNVEDSTAMKKAQLQTEEELKSLRVREEYERKLLEEDLRRQSMQSAFHYDVEMMIQRAADGVISQQGTWAQSQQSSSRRLRDLELEKEELRGELERREVAIGELQAMAVKWEGERSRWESQTQQLAAAHVAAVSQLETQRQLLVTELQARRDVEVELDALISARAGLATDVESAVSVKFEQRIQELMEQVTD
eukprot:gene5573-11222_t